MFKQIKGPQLRELLGVVSPRRELWHHVQCSMLKDPLTHKQVYVMSQVKRWGQQLQRHAVSRSSMSNSTGSVLQPVQRQGKGVLLEQWGAIAEFDLAGLMCMQS